MIVTFRITTLILDLNRLDEIQLSLPQDVHRQHLREVRQLRRQPKVANLRSDMNNRGGQKGLTMDHIILMGDSILDNGAYVSGGEPIIDQLRSRLPRGDRADLLAVDGSVIGTMPKQIAIIPDESTHLVISIGGNNALEHTPLLRDTQSSAPELFRQLADVQLEFADKYRQMLLAILNLRKRTIICTIYDTIPGLEPEAVTALSVFNDAIIRLAVEFGLPVLDLRLVCDELTDYSTVSPIEPSERGGSKIARAILRVISGHDFARTEAAIYR